MHAEEAVFGIVPGDEAGWSVRIGRWEIIGRLLVEGACTSFVGQKKLRGRSESIEGSPSRAMWAAGGCAFRTSSRRYFGREAGETRACMAN